MRINRYVLDANIWVSYTQKRLTLTREKKLGKVHYAILIIFIILHLLYHRFLELTMIGHDWRYTLYFHILPIGAGIVLLGLYRWDFLITRYATAKGTTLKLFVLGFYLLQGLICSYLTVGLVSKAAWDYINQRIADQETAQQIYCPVDRFYTGKRSSYIDFKFRNRYQTFSVRHAVIANYDPASARDYQLALTTKEVLWGHFIVYDWQVVPIH